MKNTIKDSCIITTCSMLISVLTAVIYIALIASRELTGKRCFELQPFNLTMANFNGNKLEIPTLDVGVKLECITPFVEPIAPALLIGAACGVLIASSRIIYELTHKDNIKDEEEQPLNLNETQVYSRYNP